MKFLLDENVPLSIKKIINNFGYKTTTLKDELSIKKNAIIITLDSDFLSIKKELQKKCKIIYIKTHPRDPKIIAKILQKYLEDAVTKLNNPGKIIVSENDIKFESS